MGISVADARREAILDAAYELIAANESVTWPMTDLARSTGLSRPAIYQYFDSREHILGEILVNEIADLSNAIDRVVGQQHDPREQVRVWVHYSLAHVSSERHRVMSRISVEHLPSELRGELRALHGFFLTTLISPLAQLQMVQPASHAHLIFASVSAAAARIGAGASFTGEAAVLERFVLAGISDGLTGSGD